jgi:membrane-bound lytic murein transglycosylase D
MRGWRTADGRGVSLATLGWVTVVLAGAPRPCFAQEEASPAPLASLSEATSEAASEPEPLPMPPALVPQVNFWKRVYSEIDTAHGFIHDARHLDVVYATVPAPSGTRRAQRHWLATQKQKYGAILTALGRGKRDNLTPEEAHVLSCWPADVSPATLSQAAHDVRFQSGQKDKFVAGLLRSRLWMPHIVSTFAAYGLPRELAALPHVESSFNLRAYSKARAAGIFQFTAATARLFMRMDNALDERLDPIRATEAAAKLLASNFKRTGAWPIAITSYNHGTEGMRRAMRVLNTSDLTEIIARYHAHRFGFASRNFYAELLAAWEVSSHAEQYFGELPEGDATEYASVTTDAYYRATSVARALGVDIKVLKEHNMALKAAVWSGAVLIPKGFTLRLPHPPGEPVQLAEKLALISDEERYLRPDATVVAAVRVQPRRATARAALLPAMTSEAQQAAAGVMETVYNPAAPPPFLAPWRPDFTPLRN